MIKDLPDPQKLDILLRFTKEFNLKETEDQAVYTMDCGTGYTLFASIQRSWVIEFNDGVEKTKYDIESPKVPYTNAKDARTLWGKYRDECKKVLDESNRGKPGQKDPEPEKAEVVDDREEKARLERDENERKLAEMEKFEQERQQAEEKSKKPDPPKQDNFKKPEPSNAIYSQPDDVFETAPASVKGEVRLLDILSDLVDDDLIQLFGKTGTCKTSIAIQAALEARKVGKSVYYLDPEKNISKKKKAEMLQAGVTYTPYTPSNQTGNFETVRDLEALHEFIKKIPKVDLLIIDSLGLPCLSVYCAGNQREQGQTLQKMMLISSTLKSYANRNHSMVLVINQPESDMNKDPNTERRSFGDKVEFYYKELLKTAFVAKSPNKTSVVVKTYRSRDYGQGYKLFTVEISDKGVKVIQ